MSYLNYLHESMNTVEEDPVYINKSDNETENTIGTLDDEDPNFDKHMQFLKNSLRTADIKGFVIDYLNEKNAHHKKVERAISYLLKRYWTGEFTFDDFRKAVKKKLPLNKTMEVSMASLTNHVKKFFDPRMFEELFQLTISGGSANVGEGEILLWFIFGNLLNPKKGDIITTDGEDFEIKKAFGQSGFRFVSQKDVVKWKQLRPELINLAEKYKLNVPILAGSEAKSFVRSMVSEFRTEMERVNDNNLYTEFTVLMHPYRQTANDALSEKVGMLKTVVKDRVDFENYIVACQFYAYTHTENFNAIGIWVTSSNLVVVAGDGLDNFTSIYNVASKYLKANTFYDNTRGPGMVKSAVQ
jgi:hypothetical protein